MDERNLFAHYLQPDHNGEPVCACGFDPAQQHEESPTNRGAAIEMVAAHKRQQEAEC